MITPILCFFTLLVLLILSALLAYFTLLMRTLTDEVQTQSELTETRHAELIETLAHATRGSVKARPKPLIKKPVQHSPSPETQQRPTSTVAPPEDWGHKETTIQQGPPPFVSPGPNTQAIRYSTIPCPSCDYVHMVNMSGEQKRFVCPKCKQPIEIE